jgi:hypothetical protein
MKKASAANDAQRLEHILKGAFSAPPDAAIGYLEKAGSVSL